MIDASFTVTRGGFRLRCAQRFPTGVTAVLGRSGAGKTTLLHALAGLLRPDGGAIRVADRPVFDAEAGVCVPPHRRRVGVVFQEARLFPHRSVRQNLLYGAGRLSGGERQTRLEELTALLDLAPLLGRPTASLSGGERQRVALGRTLLSDPRALLLDEPLAAVDRAHRAEILPFLRGAIDQLTIPVLYVSHNVPEALAFADRAAVLKGGELSEVAPYHELLHREALLQELLGLGLLNALPARVARSEPETSGTLLRLVGPDARAAGSARDGATDGIEIWAAPIARPVGARVTALLRPEDIALARGPVSGTSLRNQVAGTLRRITERRGVAFAEIEVRAPHPLVAEITPSARRELALEPGQPVTCLFKANAVRCAEG